VIAKENISVPAGNFDCWKINVSEFNEGILVSKRSYWFSTKIGLIKEVGVKIPSAGVFVKTVSGLRSFKKGSRQVHKRGGQK